MAQTTPLDRMAQRAAREGLQILLELFSKVCKAMPHHEILIVAGIVLSMKEKYLSFTKAGSLCAKALPDLYTDQNN